MTKGSTRKNSRKASAEPIKIQRTGAGSVHGRRTGRATCGTVDARRPMASTAMTPPGPGLDKVDDEQQDERGDQHQGGDRRRAGVIELLRFDDAAQRTHPR